MVSTGRTAAWPSSVWPSSSRKSSRVVSAVTSTAGCELAAERPVELLAVSGLRDAEDGALATWGISNKSGQFNSANSPFAQAVARGGGAQFAYSATAGYVASRPTQCVSSQ